MEQEEKSKRSVERNNPQVTIKIDAGTIIRLRSKLRELRTMNIEKNRVMEKTSPTNVVQEALELFLEVERAALILARDKSDLTKPSKKEGDGKDDN